MSANQVLLKAGQILMQEGEKSQSMYWVHQGQLTVTRRRGDGDVHLGNIYQGELVGELSFLDKEPRSATVKALTDAVLIEIPLETFDSIFKNQPKWLEVLVKTLSERLRHANARIKV